MASCTDRNGRTTRRALLLACGLLLLGPGQGAGGDAGQDAGRGAEQHPETPADASPRVTLEVSAPAGPPDAPVLLTLRAVGVEGEPDLKPLLGDFALMYQSARVMPGAGQREWLIGLRPLRGGRLRIPAIAVGGARSDPTWVEVGGGRDAAEAADRADARVPAADVLMEVSAEPESPYVMSRLRYRVRVLARVPLRDATLSEPAAEGALVRRLGKDRRFDSVRNGLDYRVIERLYVVVPRRAGRLSIEAPTLSAAVPLRALDGGERGDGLPERRALVERTGELLTLDVRPPPGDALRPWLPAESVSISERWDPEPGQARTGEPMLRRILVEAVGVGLGGVALPDAPEAEGLRVYTEPLDTEEQVIGEDLGLRVEQTQTLVPTASGLVRVPELTIPWWSLGMDEPRLARLPSRDLLVEPSASGVGAAGATADGDALRRRFIERASADPWGLGWLALGLGLGWLITLAFLLRERRRQRSTRGGAVAPDLAEPTARECIARFRRGCERHDPEAARAALAAWALAEATPSGTGGVTRGVSALLRQRGGGDGAMAALAELDGALYGRGGARDAHDAPSWQGGAALGAIGPLLEPTDDPKPDNDERLPPLFPESGSRG